MSSVASIEIKNGVIAQRIRFVAEPPRGATPLLTLTDPVRRYAVCEEVPPGVPPSDRAAADELCVLFLPGDSATPVDWRHAGEEWLDGPALECEQGAIELIVESDRVLWRPGRAVIIGGGERSAETLAGLVEFSFHESELRKLECELEADWPRAESDALVAHDIDRRALARSARQISEMSRQTALRRIRFARLSPRLEKPSFRLGEAARRMVDELAHEVEVADRLKHVDDRLEVFESLYELANDRLADFSYFRLEYRLEAWIILILVIEVLLMAFELWWSWWLR
ncbi:MAG TPA: hypothetical protein VGX78_05125 [Pirellulales bacterium]|nr:hypothetical protein [Pirellulales bacterium]